MVEYGQLMRGADLVSPDLTDNSTAAEIHEFLEYDRNAGQPQHGRVDIYVSHPNCAVEDLVYWAHRGNLTAVCDARLPVKEIRKLYASLVHRDSDVLRELLTNPATPGDILEEVACDRSRDLFWVSIAEHPNLFPSTQEVFASDPNEMIRATIAERPDLTPRARMFLYNDPSGLVITGLLLGGHGDRSLEERALGMGIGVRVALARSSKNPDILVKLSCDPEEWVRYSVLNNLSAPDAARVTAALLGTLKFEGRS